jgi:hypothetical protein
MPLGILDFLNSREDAVVLWATVFFVSVLVASRGEILSSFADVFRAVALKLLLVFGAAAVYCALVIYLAELAGLWHVGTLKETLYWFAVGGIPIIALAIERSPKGFGYLRDVMGRAVALTFIVEFVVNLYVLPLFFEFVLVVPFSIWLAYAQVAGQKNLAMRRLAEKATTYVGFFVIGYITLRAATDLDGLLTRDTLESFLVAPALTLAFIPFLYFLGRIVRSELANLDKERRARQVRLASETGPEEPLADADRAA